MRWLVLSIVLTVVLNLGLRAFPSASRTIGRAVFGAGRRIRPSDEGSRILFPWRSMIYASIALTVFVNLIIWVL